MKAFWRFSITISEGKKIVEISRFESVAKNIKG
jgi:hypothetical protein